MVLCVALVGWALAVSAIAMALRARQDLGSHREATVRAAHELRGPLTALALAVERGAGWRTGDPELRRALQLDVARARVALSDLAASAGRPHPASGMGAVGVEVERVRVGAGEVDLGGTEVGVGEVDLGGTEVGAGEVDLGGTEVGAGEVDVDVTEGGVVTGEVDVSALVSDVVAAARTRADAAGAMVRACWRGVPATVHGDRVRLAQALGTLVDNAIEHGGGSVTVTAGVRGSTVRIEVGDRGPGLTAPVAAIVRRARGGRGLRGRGLAIAVSIAAAHGGRVSAAPSASGARMVLELPLAGEVASRHA